MKKISVFTIIAAALIFFIGCKKKNDNNNTPSSSVTTLKGQVKAELNLTTAGYENVPDGTKIIFLIDPNDLLNEPDTASKLDAYRYTAVVSGGIYTVNLPARNEGTMVKVIADEFEYFKVLDNSGSATSSTRVVYTAPESLVLLYAGTTEFHDVTYY